MGEEKVNGEVLEDVAGGGGPQNDIYNLANFVYRTVFVPPGTYLVMQQWPGGTFMPVSYSNGEAIFVNQYYYNAGYLLAYKNGTYGLVDALYVR